MKILTVPNQILHRQAEPVGKVDAKIQGIIDRMFILMYKYQGVGLAANQVGVPLQIVVINEGYKSRVLINPTIQHIVCKGTEWDQESCLSIPGYTRKVKRSTAITVRSCNRYGKEQNFQTYGLLARIILHEFDHLRGVLIND